MMIWLWCGGVLGFIYRKGLKILFEMQVNGAVKSNWQGNE